MLTTGRSLLPAKLIEQLLVSTTVPDASKDFTLPSDQGFRHDDIAYVRVCQSSAKGLEELAFRIKLTHFVFMYSQVDSK